jgi:L-threonylcarbamoyladenylate synthase
MLNNIGTDLNYARRLLAQGQVVVIPTETVYGLAADADNDTAIAKVFSLKNRPMNHPLIVHIAAAELLTEWAINIPDVAYLLAKHFWPGPLTMVLQSQANVSPRINANQSTVALRCPQHPLTTDLLQHFRGLCAPSANRFGQLSPTRAEHVQANFTDSLPYIIQGDACVVGIESTIIDLSSTRSSILRPGIITQTELEAVCGYALAIPAQNAPTVPGTLPSHYMPRATVILTTTTELATTIRSVPLRNTRLSVLSYTATTAQADIHWQTMPVDAKAYAQQLYHALHICDGIRSDLIIIELPPQTALWAGIHDRLSRMVNKNRI